MAYYGLRLRSGSFLTIFSLQGCNLAALGLGGRALLPLSVESYSRQCRGWYLALLATTALS